jgi:hypothetical protein
MWVAVIVLGLIATGVHGQAPMAEELLKAAITEQQGDDYQSAIRDYRKALQLRPDMVEAKVNLGAALSRVGQYDEAIFRSGDPEPWPCVLQARRFRQCAHAVSEGAFARTE